MGALKRILPLFLFVFIVFILWRGLGLHPTQVPSPLINKSAPSFKLPTLFDENKFTTNQDFIGHVTLLNVWATWCYTCVEENEFLKQIANHSDFVLYGLDYKDDPKTAKQWLDKFGNPYSMIAVDSDGSVAIDFGVYGTPETFIIDKKGFVRYKHIGPLTQDTWEKTLKPLVEKLQGETT